ncbi:MAG: MFS transporter [Nitrospiraceae bacterium]|nr:MFS transporter [Nitrospiraceae bacterium]
MPLYAAVFSMPVLVASLGYFVDIYDLVLFSIVRVPSLEALGISGKALMDKGVYLLNMQMAGMLLGGIVWGILGDRKGRLKILFGSITLYSLANLANGFATTLGAYSALRFVAGVGLAGELGAGITLVSELLPRQSRGYGTMAVATVGVSGAILANYITLHFEWRTAYFLGAGLGFALLLMRIGVYESGMFRQMEALDVRRGDFLSLFMDRKRFSKYIKSILIGLPIWFAVGVLVTFSPEFAQALHVTGAVSAGNAVMFCYLGLIFGDFTSGFLSQQLNSRKKIVLLYIALSSTAIAAFFLSSGISAGAFYGLCAALGFAIGYWAIFVTIAAEQFGTNLRATVATTVPNFVRGAVVPITFAFQALKSAVGILGAGMAVAAVCILAALYALSGLEETFGKHLDYTE